MLKPRTPNRAALLAAAAFGTLFWSLHPLRAESVAWISSRKDVLCMFWYLLGMLAYVRKAPRAEWLLPMSFGCFVMAYMSKPIAVIFPVTLILVEYALYLKIRWREIGGFFYIALAFSVITVCAQDKAICGTLPLTTRALNAFSSVGVYVTQTVFPSGLCFFYPYVKLVSLTDAAWGALVPILVALVFGRPALQLLRQYPPVPLGGRTRAADTEAVVQEPDNVPLRGYLLGVGWFFVALLPVIGIIHVGIASHADRYTYLAGVGLSIALAVGVFQMIIQARKAVRGVVFVCCVGVLAALGCLCDQQVATWRDSETLFTHAIRVTDGNYVAHGNLATVYYNKGRYLDAFKQTRLYVAQTYPKEGIRELMMVLGKLSSAPPAGLDILTMPIDEKNDPLAAQKYHALGLIASDRNLTFAAEAFARKSIGLDPGDGYAWELLGCVLGKDRRYEEALAAMGEAQRRLPKSPQVRLMIRVLQDRQRNETR